MCIDVWIFVICFGGGGKFIFEIKFLGGWGGVVLPGIHCFLKKIFLCFVVELY